MAIKYLNLPIFVNKESIFAEFSESKCYFCNRSATASITKEIPEGAINENELTYDFDRKACFSYRVSSSFMEINNSENNPTVWKAWTDYLQGR